MKYITVESVFYKSLTKPEYHDVCCGKRDVRCGNSGLIFKVCRGIGAIAKLNGMYL